MGKSKGLGQCSTIPLSQGQFHYWYLKLPKNQGNNKGGSNYKVALKIGQGQFCNGNSTGAVLRSGFGKLP